MTKFWAVTFSLLVLALSFYGIETHSYYLNLLFDTDILYSSIRIALAVGLLMYAFVPIVRTYLAQEVFSAMGIILMFLAGLLLVSPSLLGSLEEYVTLGDTFVFLETGILARIMAIELPSYKPQPLTKVINTYDSAHAS